MSYRTKTIIIAIVCVVLAAVVCAAAIKYANDEDFKNWSDGLTTTDADGDSYWDNLMPWDSDGTTGTTAKPNTTTAPSGGNDNIVTGEFVSGRNLTLYSSYSVNENTGGGYNYGFIANGLKANTNYRVRITFRYRLDQIWVRYYQGDGGFHTYAGYNGAGGLEGFAVYDDDTREVNVDFVLRTDSTGSVRFALVSSEVVYTGDAARAYADSLLSGYSVSLTQTDAGISECLCHLEAVG